MQENTIIDNEIEATPEVAPEKTTETKDNNKDPRHSECDPLKFVRVRFPGNAKSQPFLVGSRSFQYGQTIVTSTLTETFSNTSSKRVLPKKHGHGSLDLTIWSRPLLND